MIERITQHASAFGLVAFILAAVLLCGTCKKWQWDECRKVGHSATYCAADGAGCFGGTSRKSQ